MTDLDVHNLYTPRTQAVVTLCAAVLAAGSASAGAWEEFERRCLLPMEANAEPILSGLDRVEAQTEGAKTLEVYSSVSDELANYFTVGRDADEDKITCGLALEGMDALPEAITGPLALWSTDAVVRGRYEAARHSGHHTFELFHSTTWREPKLEVEFYAVGPLLYLTVRETDLDL